jgi:hypothetical protein
LTEQKGLASETGGYFSTTRKNGSVFVFLALY